MIAYANIKPGPGFQAGRAGLYYAQRLATGPRFRRSVARAIASTIRLRHGAGVWATAPACVNAGSSLRKSGIAMLSDLIDRTPLSTMSDYFLGRNVIGPGNRETPLDRLPAGATMAAYPLRTVLECPALMELVNAPAVLRIAADYLGCKPTLSSLGVRWSFPGEGEKQGTQHFHRDPDDWRFLKLFAYLTDVHAGSGPHAFVMTSHLTAGEVRARQYERVEVERSYGADNVRTVLGPRGTVFMADTYGIHAGIVPTCAPRLILQAQYSLLPVFAFRYEAMPMSAAPGIDPYVNRLLVAAPGRA